MSTAIEAFKKVDFSWVRSLESVWNDNTVHVSGANDEAAISIIESFIEETKDPARKPPGQIVIGEAGVGKTHLIADLRRRTWEAGGWFVMLDVLGITDFWRSAALSFITSLLQIMPDGRQQYEAILAGVARRFKVEQQVQKAFSMPEIEPRQVVDLLVKGLMNTDMHNAMKHQDVFRALALLKSHDLGTVGIAHSWLQGYDADESARHQLGFVAPPPSPVELVA